MNLCSFVALSVLVLILEGQGGAILMVNANQLCVMCVQNEGKSFCPTTSARHKITNVLTLNNKPNDSKNEQCRGKSYVLTHSCDYSKVKGGWIDKVENCPEWGEIDASTIKTLTHGEKTSWTKTEATAATIRVLKAAFIGVSIASSAGAVSVGGPVLLAGMASFWLYNIAENRHKLEYKQLLTMCQDAINKLAEPMIKLSGVEQTLIKLREEYRTYKQEKLPDAVKHLANYGSSEKCVAARDDAMQSISSDTDMKKMIVGLIDAGCLTAPEVLSESSKAYIAELISDIRSSSDGLDLSKRINDIELEGLGETVRVRLTHWKVKASAYVNLIMMAQSRDLELEKLRESVTNTIARLDGIARDALQMMNEHVRSHILNERAQEIATHTDVVLTGVQIVAAIGIAADTGEICNLVKKGLLGGTLTGLNQFLSGTLPDKVKAIDNGITDTAKMVDEKGEEAIRALGNAVIQAKEKASETYRSLFSSQKSREKDILRQHYKNLRSSSG
jgi:hypothetical protein